MLLFPLMKKVFDFEKFTGIEGLITERISLVEELGLYWTEDPCKNKEKNKVSLLKTISCLFSIFKIDTLSDSILINTARVTIVAMSKD